MADAVAEHPPRLAPRAVGVESVRLPPRSPNMNAYAERLVRSTKEECFTKIIPSASGTRDG
jgi:transposase InsO family protein